MVSVSAVYSLPIDSSEFYGFSPVCPKGTEWIKNLWNSRFFKNIWGVTESFFSCIFQHRWYLWKKYLYHAFNAQWRKTFETSPHIHILLDPTTSNLKTPLSTVLFSNRQLLSLHVYESALKSFYFINRPRKWLSDR